MQSVYMESTTIIDSYFKILAIRKEFKNLPKKRERKLYYQPDVCPDFTIYVLQLIEIKNFKIMIFHRYSFQSCTWKETKLATNLKKNKKINKIEITSESHGVKMIQWRTAITAI
jgi:hypothetical protein